MRKGRCRPLSVKPVRPRFIIFGTRPVLIPKDLWGRMERMITEATGIGDTDDPFRCSNCGKAFGTSHGRDDHTKAATA